MQSIPEEEKTEFRNVKIEKEDKGFIRNLYTKLLPTRASKPIYLSYFVGRLVTSFIFNIIMYFSLQFFIVNFNSLDAIMWGMIGPLLIIFFFTDRSNMLFKDYYNFLDNNNFNIFIVIIFSLIDVLIIVYIFSLSFEAEKDRKKYFPRITRDLLEKNKLISIKNFANELNVNEGVISIWLDLINPDLQIMKNNRYIKTTQRSISDSELEVIMEQLRQAQIEYDEASSKEK